jgi:hypothetical protein
MLFILLLKKHNRDPYGEPYKDDEKRPAEQQEY